MDGERSSGTPLGGEDRRQRRFVQGLVAANAVALVALAVVTLTGEDSTGAARTVPVAATGTAPQVEPGPAADPAPEDAAPEDAAPEDARPEDAQAEAAQPATERLGAERPDAQRAEGEGAAGTPAGTAPADRPVDLPRLDVTLTPPAGFAPVRGDEVTRSAGPFDLAVEFDPLHRSYPRARLAELGLQATGTAAWQSPTDTMVVATYQFPDAGAAATFVDEAAAPWRSEPEVMPHDLRGVPGSQAFHQMGRGDQSQFALVARDDRVWVVGLAGASAADHSMDLVHQTLHQVGA